MSSNTIKPLTPAERERYRVSVQTQLEEWVAGRPVHNTIADECCPDFSCCHPSLLWPEERRKQFAAAPPEQQYAMYGEAMGSLLVEDVEGTPVHIIQG